MNLNKLKKLSINIKDNIILYDYKKSNIITYNNLNFILNNDLNYDYVFIIDYSKNQLDIDVYKNSHILFNICYDLYYNKAAFKTLNDFILNNNKDYKIITINKAFLNIE